MAGSLSAYGSPRPLRFAQRAVPANINTKDGDNSDDAYFAYTALDEVLEISSMVEEKTKMVVPYRHRTKLVTKFAKETFAGHTKVEDITLQDTIGTIIHHLLVYLAKNHLGVFKLVLRTVIKAILCKTRHSDCIGMSFFFLCFIWIKCRSTDII